MKVEPYYKNFCGGNYQDWLEVMLLPECNGKSPPSGGYGGGGCAY